MDDSPRASVDHAGARQAAVLVPLFRDAAGELRVVLVVRGDHGLHANQLAFPGGRREDSDPDLLSAALREASEEVGLDRARVRTVGALEPLGPTVSNYIVHPFVAVVPADTAWSFPDGEVVGLLTPAVAEVADLDTREQRPYFSPMHDREFIVDHVPLGEHTLWGLTLRIIDDLLPRLQSGEIDV